MRQFFPNLSDSLMDISLSAPEAARAIAEALARRENARKEDEESSNWMMDALRDSANNNR